MDEKQQLEEVFRCCRGAFSKAENNRGGCVLIVCASDEKWRQPPAALSVNARLAPLNRAHIFLMQYSTRWFPYGTEEKKKNNEKKNPLSGAETMAPVSHCFMETDDFA